MPVEGMGDYLVEVEPPSFRAPLSLYCDNGDLIPMSQAESMGWLEAQLSDQFAVAGRTTPLQADACLSAGQK